MSGPFGSQQWMYSSGFYPHEIGNSVRLDSNSQFNRTPSSAGNRKTYTWSAWFKRSKLSDSNYDGLFSAGTGGVNRDVLYFDNADYLHWNGYTSSSYDFQYKTSQQFRDPSAWYHIVLVQDTTQSTASDRTKIYINGELITSYSTSNDASLNYDGYVNNTNEHTIGSTPYDTTYFDGYIAEVNFVDGTALTPASFGETKADTWIPKKYTGSYGTNGYYLDFATRATDPLDASGNGNNFSSTNVVSTDLMPDSPTNNWATLNPLGPRRNGANFGTGNQTQGNLTITSTSASYFDDTEATLFNNGDSGKWYYEIRLDALQGNGGSGYTQFNIGGYYIAEFYTPSTVIAVNSGTYNITAFSDGDILMFAVDQDNGKGWFGINGSWYTVTGTPDPAAGTNPHTTFGSLDRIGQVQIRSNTSSVHRTVTINYGQDSSFAGQATAQGNTDANGRGDFYYSPPAGYLALCSANLPDPATAINPAVNNSPQDQFNAVLYTGDGTSSHAITGVGFQPDWLWIKSRSTANHHSLFDVVRGSGSNGVYGLQSSSTIGEFDGTNVSSLDSDGFTLGGANSPTNASGTTYVGWNWKAGGSGVSNTDGDITSTVSANTDAGFSIVTYNGSSAGTVGHGLGSTPKIVIQKVRNQSGDYWWFGTTAIDGSMDFLKLNDTTAKANSGYTAPTSSVFSNVTFSGATSNVAYCFAEVEGFSKFGSYTGNGSADGPFINTGFRPAFVIIKRTDTAEHWHMQDSTRSSYNWDTATVYANLSNAEYTGAGFEQDFVSNGFKFRTTNGGFNASGGTYLYMAFAEMPFKYANAR